MLRHVRKRYGCPGGTHAPRTAALPPQPLPKSNASANFLAMLLDGALIHMDETVVQVLQEPGKAPASHSYIWVQTGGPPERPVILFDYDPSRSGQVPVRLLEGYRGYLMTDGYDGYNAVVRAERIEHLICWAHVRRRFVEAARVQKEALADELFQAQPTLLGAVLVLSRMGVPMDRVEFALNLLLVCFQAMKESGLPWPRISEGELDRQAARYSAIVRFSDGMHPAQVQQAQQQFAAGHPEPALLAYVSNETAEWLANFAPLESDKYVLLSTMNVVNCIAHVADLLPLKVCCAT